ncbi:Crp/Fnr family transcriptional regulator [Amycolatopsis decaplanina]|uniref:CRP-like regulatory protein n=1 Tax=Amycolatopsis decaplanina DSM 44594 TaxID=1284240 RepID=M2Z3A3_9PSEU|nr:cyclic nucleotide-binding domain-containing protein [Amycolatopsis decaplanina]EME55069.1 CRP-like regulatory protein [Amycolatopsis decaplanina DSM 44594]
MTSPILDRLSDVQRSSVIAIGRIEDYETGARLFDEGGDADRCWLVISGHIVVDAHLGARGSVPLQSVGPGEPLGWSWLIPPYRWHFGAETAAPTRALVLDAERLRALIESDDALGFHFSRALLEALATRLQATRLRLLDLYRNPA